MVFIGCETAAILQNRDYQTKSKPEYDSSETRQEENFFSGQSVDPPGNECFELGLGTRLRTQSIVSTGKPC